MDDTPYQGVWPGGRSTMIPRQVFAFVHELCLIWCMEASPLDNNSKFIIQTECVNIDDMNHF